MTQVAQGPINIEEGNSANFVAQFIDSDGNTTVPTGATIQVSYTNLSNTSQLDTVTLTQVGSYFVGTWSSTSAALGLATWNLYATGDSTSVQTGLIRVINHE